MSKYLIVVDVQNDFVNGSLGTKEAQAIIPKVNEKINNYVENNDSVIFTRDLHFSDYLETTNEGKHLPVKHCIYGTSGRQIYSGIDIPNNVIIIDKSTFGFTNWKNYIKGYSNLEIELVGLCTDICVVSNALILKSLFPEAKIKVDPSACAGTTPGNHIAALAVMESCQIDIG